ncbi:MAG TPA: hypothetical protein ENJ95_21430 [Bacteroidetes bacterium]|nr:hypothetical protein [Bacteroidota bacterium]
MKNLFFLFAFMGFFAFTATAQNKACCAKKASSAKVCTKAMDKAASADASIVKQVSNDGEVSYTRKSVCPVTGKVSFTDVEYCTKSGKFVNVSPSGKKAACSKKASTCTKKASATKVSSASAEKACCDKGKEKACCAKGAKKSCHSSSSKASNESKAVNETGAKVKLVSESANQ